MSYLIYRIMWNHIKSHHISRMFDIWYRCHDATSYHIMPYHIRFNNRHTASILSSMYRWDILSITHTFRNKILFGIVGMVRNCCIFRRGCRYRHHISGGQWCVPSFGAWCDHRGCRRTSGSAAEHISFSCRTNASEREQLLWSAGECQCAYAYSM